MPSNHKRHAPARTANGPASPDAAAASTEIAPPESQSNTAQAVHAPPPPQASQPQSHPAQPQPHPPQPSATPPPSPQRRPGEGLNITDLKDMSIQKLTQIAKDLTVGGATGMRKRS